MENCEDPVTEMKRRFRLLGGTKGVGEADVHVRSRAQRRINGMLPRSRQISDRTSYALWHGEKADIPSHVMDVVRALTEPKQTIAQKLTAFIEASQQVQDALVQEREALEAELAAAEAWRAFDQARGVVGGAQDQRRAMQAVRRTVAASLLLKSNPDSDGPSSLVAAEEPRRCCPTAAGCHFNRKDQPMTAEQKRNSYEDEDLAKIIAEIEAFDDEAASVRAEAAGKCSQIAKRKENTFKTASKLGIPTKSLRSLLKVRKLEREIADETAAVPDDEVELFADMTGQFSFLKPDDYPEGEDAPSPAERAAAKRQAEVDEVTEREQAEGDAALDSLTAVH